MAIVLMRVLYYTDHLETLSVFSNDATLNFSTFWPRLHASFSRSKNGKLTSETTLVENNIACTYTYIVSIIYIHILMNTEGTRYPFGAQ